MSDQALLSDLCSICYTETPKYKCPRCKTQTCSLPCYKKHQQRASCSGKRDPAAYLKKSEWATPSGIDRDYNYLKGVERTIDHASTDAAARGIAGVGANVSKNVARGRRPDSMLQRYLAQNQIKVERAPVGMSRQKSNLTRPTKRNHVVWTVEWVDVDGERTVQNDCLESNSIHSLYELLHTEKRNAKQRQIDGHDASSSQRGTKRKRNEAKPEQAEGSATDEQSAKEQSQTVDSAHKDADSETAKATNDNHAPEAGSSTSEPTALSTNSIPEDSKVADAVNNQTTNGEDDDDDPIPSTSPNSTTAPATTKNTFYLLRPSTATSARVLDPLDPEKSLTLNLKSRTVQEYPTIIVLGEGVSLDALPKGYMLGSEYEKKQGAQKKAIDGSSLVASAPGGQVGSKEEEDDGEVDAQGILDMLKRDVRF